MCLPNTLACCPYATPHQSITLAMSLMQLLHTCRTYPLVCLTPVCLALARTSSHDCKSPNAHAVCLHTDRGGAHADTTLQTIAGGSLMAYLYWKAASSMCSHHHLLIWPIICPAARRGPSARLQAAAGRHPLHLGSLHSGPWSSLTGLRSLTSFQISFLYH